MAYYPDCGHLYCDCPAHPSYKIGSLKEEKKNLKKKNQTFRGEVSQFISQVEFTLRDPELDNDEKMVVIKAAIRGFKDRLRRD
tara:strand:+ start:770 stop:1018 length:249 start_codon:yes stop_codon:yes gene_type:complete